MQTYLSTTSVKTSEKGINNQFIGLAPKIDVLKFSSTKLKIIKLLYDLFFKLLELEKTMKSMIETNRRDLIPNLFEEYFVSNQISPILKTIISTKFIEIEKFIHWYLQKLKSLKFICDMDYIGKEKNYLRLMYELNKIC